MDRRLSALVVAFAAACTKKEAPPSPSPAPVAVAPDGRKIVESACLSCHTDEMLRQQRLTEAQWNKTVAKMAKWGANLDETEKKPLVDYLAASYGPDAGAFDPPTISADAAALALEATDDGPYANGSADHGKAVFVDKCAACHGQDAHGGIGVNLVERPILYRGGDVAEMVKKGRGKMLPLVIGDRDLADILAYLRTLRNKPF